MFNKMKLRQRMLVTILGLIVITLTGLLGYVGVSTQKAAVKSAHDLASESGQAIATSVQREIETAADSARTLAETMEAMKLQKNTNRDLVSGIIKQIADSHPEFLGAWTIWEPNAFDGQDVKFTNKPGHDPTGRVNIAWTQSDSGVKFNANVDYEKPGVGDYYLLSKNSGEETMLDPYVYNFFGKDVLMTSYVVPIHQGDKVIGVVGVDLQMEAIQTMTDGVKLFKTGFAGVISNNGTIVTSAVKERVGKKYNEVFSDATVAEVMSLAKEGREHSLTDSTGMYRDFTPIMIGESKTPWTVSVVVPEKEVTAESTRTMITVVVAGLLALLLLASAIYFLTNSIVKPIIRSTMIAEDMAGGNFTSQIPDVYLNRGDEIGMLARAFSTMGASLRSMIGGVQSSAQNVAAASQEISATTEQVAGSSASQAEAAQTMQELFSELSVAISSVKKLRN
jgi:methyl-accepting chemotaxis protein